MTGFEIRAYGFKNFITKCVMASLVRWHYTTMSLYSLRSNSEVFAEEWWSPCVNRILNHITHYITHNNKSTENSSELS